MLEQNVSTISRVLAQHHTRHGNTRLFPTAPCTVQSRGQINTNCTWTQHRLARRQLLQIAKLIDCFYNKRHLIYCSLCVRDKNWAGVTFPKSATILTSTCQHPPPPAPPSSLAHPTNPEGQMERLHACKRDLHILSCSSPHNSVVIHWSKCPHSVLSPLVFIFLYLAVFLCKNLHLIGHVPWEFEITLDLKKTKTKLVHFNVQQIIYYRTLYAFLILNFEICLLGGNCLLLRCQLHFTSPLFAA